MTPGIVVLLGFMMALLGFVAGVSVKDNDGSWYGIPAIFGIIVLFLVLLANAM